MSKRRLSESEESDAVSSEEETESDTSSVHSDSSDSDTSSDSTESPESDSVDSESDDEAENEMDMNHMLHQLSKKTPKNLARDLLHSLMTSKDILYWNSWGEMVRNEQRVPGTSMAALLNIALLPYKPKAKEPKGMNDFVEGLAEIGVNKKLIQNKKVLK